MVVRTRPPHLPRRPPSLPRVPRGELHAFEILGGERLVIEGWIEAESESLVTFLVENRPLAVSRPGSRETRRTWSFDLPTREISPDAVLRIEASTRAGTVRILAMGTLRPYL